LDLGGVRRPLIRWARRRASAERPRRKR
jgi:hypothetical protein